MPLTTSQTVNLTSLTYLLVIHNKKLIPNDCFLGVCRAANSTRMKFHTNCHYTSMKLRCYLQEGTSRRSRAVCTLSRVPVGSCVLKPRPTAGTHCVCEGFPEGQGSRERSTCHVTARLVKWEQPRDELAMGCRLEPI